MERQVYVDVFKTIKAINQSLQKELVSHIFRVKQATDVSSVQKKANKQISAEKRRLYVLWHELTEIEQRIHSLEMDCRLITREYQDALKSASDKAAQLKSEASKQSECTDSQWQYFQVHLGAALQESEAANDTLNSMRKQHPWIAEYNKMLTKRDQKVSEIKAELDTLKKFEEGLRKYITSFEQVEQNALIMKRNLKAAKYEELRKFLEDDAFYRALHDAGVHI